MKLSLTSYKAQYRKVKTQRGKTSVMTRACYNLTQFDFKQFAAWQNKWMNEH
jgi:hypothetical protein